MSVTAAIQLNAGVRQTLDLPGIGPTVLKFDEFDLIKTLNASSSPPVDSVGGGELTLTGGTDTLNLAAIAHPTGNKDLTGKKVVYAWLQNPGENAITIAEGASNGYQMMGGEDIVLPPGATFPLYFADGLAVVASGDRTLDVTGTSADVLNFVFVAGTPAA